MSDEQQRLRYPELSPEGIATMSATEHYLNAVSGLEASLLEMVRLRASQMNGCAFCMGLHRHELEKHHEPESRIDAVERWREAEVFTHRERAALRWAEALTNIQTGHASDEEYAAVQEHFAGKALVDLSLAIASINAWNRVSIAFRPQWNPAKAGRKTEQTAPAKGNKAVAEGRVADGQVAEGRVADDDDGKISVDEDGAQ